MGTAYEYYSKLRVMDAVFARVGAPRSMVVLGLPEKHGYDLDFVLLARRLHCPLWVYDDRPDVLAAFHEALRQLPDPAMREQVEIGRIDTLIDRPGPAGRRFHWLVSTASVGLRIMIEAFAGDKSDLIFKRVSGRWESVCTR